MNFSIFMLNHYVAFNRLDKIIILVWGTVSQLPGLVTSNWWRVKRVLFILSLDVSSMGNLNGKLSNGKSKRKNSKDRKGSSKDRKGSKSNLRGKQNKFNGKYIAY